MLDEVRDIHNGACRTHGGSLGRWDEHDHDDPAPKPAVVPLSKWLGHHEGRSRGCSRPNESRGARNHCTVRPFDEVCLECIRPCGSMKSVGRLPHSTTVRGASSVHGSDSCGETVRYSL